MIELSEIQSELFLAVVEPCPRIKDNYIINNILIVQSLPSYVDENEMSPEFSSGRKYSKLWKHYDGLNGLRDPNIEIDDRICNITCMHFVIFLIPDYYACTIVDLTVQNILKTLHRSVGYR